MRIRKCIAIFLTMAQGYGPAPGQFASWFEKTRKKKKLTQLKAAQQLDLTSPTISRWEMGFQPRASVLLRVSRWGPIKPEKLLKLLAQPS